jgi:AcrR family transcriptional regulator
MNSKEKNRNAMRQQILDAAIPEFTEQGFTGASTRGIAQRAGVSQGLLTYHFKNKNTLWYAAVDRLFEVIHSEFGSKAFDPVSESRTTEDIKLAIRNYLKFMSRNPQLPLFILENSKNWDERSHYMIDKYLRPMYQKFTKGLPIKLRVDFSPSLYYSWVGASTMIFSIPDECKYLSGIDPKSEDLLDRHTEVMLKLFFAHMYTPSEEEA